MQGFDINNFWQTLTAAVTALVSALGGGNSDLQQTTTSGGNQPIGITAPGQGYWNNGNAFQTTQQPFRSDNPFPTDQQRNPFNNYYQTPQPQRFQTPAPQSQWTPSAPISGLGSASGLIPRKLLFGSPDYSALQLSPNGDYLSWLSPINNVMNIWVQRTGDPTLNPLPITFVRDRPVMGYTWSYDNDNILFMNDDAGDENLRIYAVSVRTNQTRTVYAQKNVSASIVSQSYKRPTEIVIGLNDRDRRYEDYYLLNIATGQRSLIFMNTPEYGSVIFDDQYQLRLATKERADASRDYFRRTIDGQWVPYRTIDKSDHASTYGFDATGANMYWLENVDRDKLALFRRSFDQWKTDYRLIFESNEADVGGVMMFQTEKVPLAATVDYMKPKTYILNQSIAADFAAINQQLVQYFGLEADNFYVSDWSLDTSRWLVVYSSDVVRSKRFLYNRQTRTLTFLLETNAELARFKLSRMQPVEVPTRDGYKEVCFWSTPLGANPPYPMVLSVHGGPWASSSWGYDGEAQLMTNRGYAILDCNFRASTGYGKNWTNLGNGEWGRKMQMDLTDAVEWAIQKGYADSRKIAIFGGSYGGYAVLAGLAFTPQLFACGVDAFGPSNLETLLNAIPPQWEAGRAQLILRIGGDPRTEEGRRFLRSRSPLFFVSQMSSPLFVIQGANDIRVRQNESDSIVQALKQKGVQNLMYGLFPDEGHGFVRPENRLAYYALAEQFLQKCLGGRAEPIGSDLTQSSLQIIEGKQLIQY